VLLEGMKIVERKILSFSVAAYNVPVLKIKCDGFVLMLLLLL
jgi:hypothetical protein